MSRSSAILLAAAAAVSPLAAAPALAETESTTISYSRAALASPAAREALDARIARAVRRHCNQPGPLFIELVNGVADCEVAAMASARSQRDAILSRAGLAADAHSAGSEVRPAR